MGTVKSGKILHVLFAVMALIMVTLGCRAQTYASNSDSSFILQDEPRAHGDLTFMKKDSISGAALSGAQFLLSGTSDYGNDIVKTAGSDAYGKVLISNIEKGTYDLEETTAPDGYIPAQSAWKAVVNEDGLVALYAADGVTELSKDNGVYSLTSLDVSHFDTGNVTNMSYMFSGCSGLTSLDVSHFDTGNVTNMGYMFEGCSKLTSLDVSKFDTGNVASMDKMFQNCFGLTSLDVSKFNTGKVTNMSGMFYCCSSLTSLDVSGFDTANATNMGSMFSGCSSLTTIYAGLGWNTDKVTSSSFMFYNDSNLIGGAGTSYDSGHTDKAYARIDGGTDNPGYFTGKNTTVAPSADAMLLPGQQFNAKIKQIAGHSSATYQTSDSTIKSISWSSTEPDAQYQTDAYRVDVNNSKYNQPVYFYPGSDGAY